MSVMMRQIMTLFDEYQSKENAKHTLRAMKENAGQGYCGFLPWRFSDRRPSPQCACATCRGDRAGIRKPSHKRSSQAF
jgi:hypothetical protein